jgi:hypothetical protein
MSPVRDAPGYWLDMSGLPPPKDALGRSVAQPGSALDWGSRGRRFESCRSDHAACPHKSVNNHKIHRIKTSPACQNAVLWIMNRRLTKMLGQPGRRIFVMKRSIFLQVILFFLSLPLAFTSTHVRAQEAVLDFKTVIDVRKDGALEVYQQFKIRADRNLFKHGLVYNLPLSITSPNGGRAQRSISNMEVVRDDSPESFNLTEFGSKSELRTGGQADLKPGEYTYEIRYTSKRQILFRDGEDELVIPVAPYDWSIPVQNASVEVHLPEGRAPTRVFAATGEKDSRVGSVVVRRENTTVRVQNSRPLPPKNGMTVSISWVAGAVDRPSRQEQVLIMLKQFEHLFAPIVGIFAITCIGFLARLLRNRQIKNVKLQPPKGYSPATAQFYQDGVASFRGVVNTILGLAAKGYLTIEETEPGDFMLQRTWRESDLGLSGVERAVAVAFYQNRPTRFQINSQHSAELLIARRSMGDAVVREFEMAHLKSHKITISILAIVPVLAAIAMVILSPYSNWFVFAPLLILAGCGLLYYSAIPSDPQWQMGLEERTLTDLVNTWVTTSRGLIASAVLFAGLAVTTWRIGALEAGLVLILGAVTAWCYHGTKRVGSLGSKVQHLFESLKLALTTDAEKEISAEMPVARYEQLLPYAAAWGVHSAWADRFRRANNNAGIQNVRPRWLTTPRLAHEPTEIASLLVDGLTQAVERAVGTSRK